MVIILQTGRTFTIENTVTDEIGEMPLDTSIANMWHAATSSEGAINFNEKDLWYEDDGIEAKYIEETGRWKICFSTDGKYILAEKNSRGKYHLKKASGINFSYNQIDAAQDFIDEINDLLDC
jgi:hypothetical protein